MRAMGVGDLSVGKRIKGMATAFYGRVDAYTAPIEENDQEGLTKALLRNLYREKGEEMQARQIAAYVMRASDGLGNVSFHELSTGQLVFPDWESADA